MLRLSAVEIQLLATDGWHSFSSTFGAGLNVIRGNNTSGKSTLLSALLYGLGMEELLGHRNEAALQYALRDYLFDGNSRVEIIQSWVCVEIENAEHESVTLRRSIRSAEKDTKLIEVIKGSYLTGTDGSLEVVPTYIHDPGSAKNAEAGFFGFLERFLRLELPIVEATKGGTTKLYVQALFAALFVEQKRGWTDYIANIPYFGIRNSAQKVVEFLLGFSVFENERKRSQLTQEGKDIQRAWDDAVTEINLVATRYGLRTEGIPKHAQAKFNSSLVTIFVVNVEGRKSTAEERVRISESIEQIEKRLASSENGQMGGDPDELERLRNEISRAEVVYERIIAEKARLLQSLRENEDAREDIASDIEKNKAAAKLRSLGAEADVKVTRGACPTCHQGVDDSLLLGAVGARAMDIEENIKYLESQRKMLDRYVSATEQALRDLEGRSAGAESQLRELRRELNSLRRDFRSTVGYDIRANLQRLMERQRRREEIDVGEGSVREKAERLESIAALWAEHIRRRGRLPKEYLSNGDRQKLEYFGKTVRELSERFGYSSGSTDEILVSEEKYVPYFGESPTLRREIRSSADIKSDSSASDFVRLIWAYLLSLYRVSSLRNGNHPGLIVFDEPAQHSMSVESLRELLLWMSKELGLQSIVAASFDESEEVFQSATEGVSFSLITLGEQLFGRASQ